MCDLRSPGRNALLTKSIVGTASVLDLTFCDDTLVVNFLTPLGQASILLACPFLLVHFGPDFQPNERLHGGCSTGAEFGAFFAG